MSREESGAPGGWPTRARTSTGAAPADSLHAGARKAVREAKPVLETLARIGHVAKGLVYVTIGLLAVQVAMGAGGDTTDGKGALRELLSMPFGSALLAAMALGLFGYAAWRLVEAVLDPRREGKGLTAIVLRIGYAISGGLHALLGVTAVQMLLGQPQPSGEQTSKHWTARLLAEPYGPAIAIAIGVIVVIVGLRQLWHGYCGKFQEDLRVSEMSPAERAWARVTGKLGLAAHGVVLDIVGVGLILAALERRPARSRGFGGALTELANGPFGPIVLSVVAVGLVAYGIHMFVEARYRRLAL